MKSALLLLAQTGGEGDSLVNRFRLWVSSASGTHQALLVLGAFLLIALSVFVWAAFLRKPQRRRYSRWRRSHQTSRSGPPKAEGTGSRRRRHHRRYRSRNPTLAEAGGLPPVRQDDPPPPML